MKSSKLLSNVLYLLMICFWILMVLIVSNFACNGCITKNINTIVNKQGYAYDIKNNEVQDYCECDENEKCEKAKFSKQRFNKNTTTGMMTLIPENNCENCRACN